MHDKGFIVNVFKRLSSKIGERRVIWRYDPVIVNEAFSLEAHLDAFSKLCASLSGFTNKCIFSFVKVYAKVKRKTKDIAAVELEDMHKLARGFSQVALDSKIIPETCSEEMDFSEYGINPSACIDRKTIEDILGYTVKAKKDAIQRRHCRCIQSIDIGAYDACLHGCLYCYGTLNEAAIYRNISRHNAASPFLLGQPYADDMIANMAVKSLKSQTKENSR